MKKLVIATTNKGKFLEFSKYLSGLGLELMSLADFQGISEIEETGETFRDNALIKARASCKFTGITSVADDSGLMVDALGGAPGVFSARFGPDTETRNKKLLDLLKNTGENERTARFVCALALVRPDGYEWITEEKCEGYILKEPRGNKGFGYDPVFYYPLLGASFAELTPEIKNSISHRGLALAQFKRAIIDQGIL